MQNEDKARIIYRSLVANQLIGREQSEMLVRSVIGALLDAIDVVERDGGA